MEMWHLTEADMHRIAYMTYVALVRAHDGDVIEARRFVSHLNDNPDHRRIFEEVVIMESIRRANEDERIVGRYRFNYPSIRNAERSRA